VKRECVNFFRYFLEEWIPPALRDSPPMRRLFRSVCGLVLDTVTRGRRELKRIHYLLHAALTHTDEPT